jgi:hypothetical protein
VRRADRSRAISLLVFAVDDVPGQCRGCRAGWCVGPPGEGEARAQLRVGDPDFAQAVGLAAGVLGRGEDGDAEPALGEPGEDSGIAGFEGDSRPLTERGEAGVERGADAGPGGQRDEGEAGQVRQPDGTAPGGQRIATGPSMITDTCSVYSG